MSPNNNFNILAWYDSIDQQNHRKAYVYGTIWGLIAPNNSILPFQFVSPGSLGSVTSVVVKSLETNGSVDLTSKLTISVTDYTDDDGNAYSIIMHKGDDVLSSKLSEGRHYIELKQGPKTWYSEVFTVVSNIDCYIKLEYWDNSNLYFKGGHIEYLTGFKFVCYLSTEIGKPTYPFEEELTERDGYKFIEKQTSSKVYNMTFHAPEFMCDALRLVRMCDNIHITNHGKVYRALSFSVSVDWEDNGDVAAVDAEFETDTVVTKIANILNGPSESGLTFNDALLYEKSSPLMFDEGVVAQYTRTVQVTVEAQFVGKLIRELDEYLSEQIPETAYIAIDLGDGPALKMPLSKIAGKYWNYVSDTAEDYLIPKTAKHVFSNMDVVAYATGKYDIVLPIASAAALGAIRIGDGLSIDENGVVSVSGGAGTIKNIIIDPSTGNVLTGVTLSADGKTLTFAKDITAITTSNYATTLDTRYVKKSGDTMTGALALPYGVDSDPATGLRFKNTDSTQGTVLRWDGANNLILSGTDYSTAETKAIHIRPNGTLANNAMEITMDWVKVHGSVRAVGDVIAYSTGSGDITLPIASTSALGAVKIGDGLSISADGTLSANNTGTIGGVQSSGTGNVVTGLDVISGGKVLLYTKGLTALTTTDYATTLDAVYVKKSGDTMTGALTATKLTSNIATGTAPLSVSSTTVCANLNADMLDGLHSNNFTRSWYLGMTVDAKTNYIVFGKAYTGTLITGFTFIGTVAVQRGDSGSWHNCDNINISISAQYNSNYFAFTCTGLNNLTYRAVTLVYKGETYLALEISQNSSMWVTVYGAVYYNLNLFLTAATNVSNVTAVSTANNKFKAGLITSTQGITSQDYVHAANDIVAYSTGSGDISLPIASASALGAIKVGSGLSITSDGTLSATGTGSLGSVVVDGTGNAITTASASGTTLTLTKGTTFWHAGNDGSGSGLDADLLDGYHLSSIFREIQLAPQDLDADNLIANWVAYNPNSDMNTWGNTSWTNFPTDKPAGGFTLLNLREGFYKKQLFSAYMDSHLYIRTQYYSDGIKWSSWNKIALTTDTVSNSDMLDGKHAGVQNGQVAIYVSFPSYNTLVSLGYNTEANKTDNEEYMKGICKWAIDTYAGNDDCTLIGVARPNSSGTLILHLYSNDGKSSTTGLPRYCEGMCIHYSGLAHTFGTNNYVWKWSHSTWEGNALTATTLQTTRTLWGQNFNGSANVSGNMTGVGSITMSGQLNAASLSGMFLYGKTSGVINVNSTDASTSTYFPLYRWKSYTGRVFNLGALQLTDAGHTFGFYMFDKDRTENGFDACFFMNSSGDMKGTGGLAMNGDVIAYSTGTSNAPFKYWRPSISQGVLSWVNDTSTTTPSPVTIVGQGTTYTWSGRSLKLGTINAAGSTTWGTATNLTGQGLTYQWSGTSLRIGTIAAGEGSTSWGSYVNLQGATGPSWGGGAISSPITTNWKGQPFQFYYDGTYFICNHGGVPTLFANSGTGFNSSANIQFTASTVKGVGFSTSSDIRLKKDIETLTNMLDKINNIRAVKFRFKDEKIDRVHYGVIAQEIMEHFKDVVYYDSTDEYSVNYQELTAAISICGIKELYSLVKSQQARIEELEKRLQAIES